VTDGQEDIEMSSRLAVKPPAPAARKDLVAVPIAKAPPAARIDAAANDDAASTFSVFGDPLLGMAIGSGILFAVLAALMAFA
jgi:hypothetical protein